jgi:hypothetical protein
MTVLAFILACACLGVVMSATDLIDSFDTKKEYEDTEYPNEEDE